jgi:hypothetical protein
VGDVAGIEGPVGGAVRSTVGGAMPDTQRGAVRSRAVRGGMADVGGTP